VIARIKTIAPEAAEGLLKQLYDTAIRRAGKVFNILRLQSPRPRVLKASTQLYIEVMQSTESGLSRKQREMIATAVSSFNDCHY
jgi:alkylhydroperoxidase family enzyme